MTLRLCTTLLLLGLLAGCTSDDERPTLAPTGETIDVEDAPDPISEADASPESGEAPEAAPPTLSGVWRATDDPNVIVEFADGQFIESYEGLDTETYSYEIADSCEGSLSTEVDGFIVVSDGRCFAIVTQTDTSLEYSMVGGRGNTLSFVPAN